MFHATFNPLVQDINKNEIKEGCGEAHTTFPCILTNKHSNLAFYNLSYFVFDLFAIHNLHQIYNQCI